MIDLVGKHALVTGGGSGIGAAVAVTLAQAGANVTICGRRMEALKTTAARHRNIFARAADVTEELSVERLYRQAQTERGQFAIVVANAGGTQSAPAEKISRKLWNNTVDLNLSGAFFCVQPAISAMRERGFGRIVFIASTAGLKGYPYVAAYVAAKHGVVGLARALALETAHDGITVNAVCPGYTETPLLEAAIQRIAARGKSSERDVQRTLAADNPHGRFVQPQEVADVVLRLCADESSSVTGQAILVAGGETW